MYFKILKTPHGGFKDKNGDIVEMISASKVYMAKDTPFDFDFFDTEQEAIEHYGLYRIEREREKRQRERLEEREKRKQKRDLDHGRKR